MKEVTPDFDAISYKRIKQGEAKIETFTVLSYELEKELEDL